MNELDGYLKDNYQKSVFTQMEKGNDIWVLHLHGNKVISGKVNTNKKYDIVFHHETGEEEEIPKINIKFLYLKKNQAGIKKGIKVDKKVKENEFGPIVSPGKRNHIKNKTLFPLMKERILVFFTTLEGDILGGMVGGFTRYEIQILGKKGVPVTLLRHAIYDLRDKRKRCYLKRAVEARKENLRSKKAI